MRYLAIIAIAMATFTPAHAGWFDDVRRAVTGHIEDAAGRLADDEILLNVTQLADGKFREDDPGQDAIHHGKGSAYVVEKDGKFFVQLGVDFHTGLGPDYHVYVSPDSGINHERVFNRTEQVNLGRLSKGSGASYYEISGIDALTVGSVTIWCKQFGEFIASADINFYEEH